MSERLDEGVTLVLGGARSGKSRFAERLVSESGLSRVYLATGRAFDGEMRERIAHHRAARGDGWRTLETPTDLADAIHAEAASGTAILVDCLTLWLTNLMMDDRPVAPACEALVASLRGHDGGPLVLVSNEVGLGIVPENAMARAFRDHAGHLHQEIAALAGAVYFVAAGLPLKLKG